MLMADFASCFLLGKFLPGGRHFVFVVVRSCNHVFPRFSVLFLLYFPMAAIGYGVLGSEAGSNIIYSLAPGPAKVSSVTNWPIVRPHKSKMAE
jgi:hypothetical protein